MTQLQSCYKFIIIHYVMLVMMAGCVSKPLPVPPPSPYAIPANPHPYSASRDERVMTPSSPLSAQPQAAPVAAPRQFTSEIKIGLLLPLTGKDATLGNTLLDAATLGLDDAYSSPRYKHLTTKLTLLPQDTGDSPLKARKATQAAIDQGAQFLLGPLYGDATRAIAPLAAKHHVPTLSFSNSPEAITPPIHLLGFMLQQQASFITQHAAQGGVKHLAALIPNNDYGTLVERAVQEAVLQHQIPHFSVIKYDPASNDMVLIAAQLKNVLNQKIQMNTAPMADALFILEGGQRLEALTAALGKQGLKQPEMRYMGIGIWHNQELLGNPALVGAEFASTSLSAHQQFATRFSYEYGSTPPKIAALAYDASYVLVQMLAAQGSVNELALVQPNGYLLPATGLTRFNEDGTNLRALAILRIEEDRFLEPRPAGRFIAE